MNCKTCRFLKKEVYEKEEFYIYYCDVKETLVEEEFASFEETWEANGENCPFWVPKDIDEEEIF